jgi:hypothetical protein
MTEELLGAGGSYWELLEYRTLPQGPLRGPRGAGGSLGR